MHTSESGAMERLPLLWSVLKPGHRLISGAAFILMAPAWVTPPSISTKIAAIQGPLLSLLHLGCRDSTKPFSSHPGQDQPARGYCSLSFRARAQLPGRVRVPSPSSGDSSSLPALPHLSAEANAPVLSLVPPVLLQDLIELYIQEGQVHSLLGSTATSPDRRRLSNWVPEA